MHDQDFDSFNFREKTLFIEHALRNIPNKKRNHTGCSKRVEYLVNKYVDEKEQLTFLDDLLKLIINPTKSTTVKGKCDLIELALCEHFSSKNYSRYYGDAALVQDLVVKYIVKEKQLDFLNDLLTIINK